MSRRIAAWITLALLGVAGAAAAYWQGQPASIGDGAGIVRHHFFDTLASALAGAAAFGLILGATLRRTDSRIEGDRVLRHDGPAMLEHWTIAISSVVLIASGLGLGLFATPRLLPPSGWTAFLFNVHFVASLYFVFGCFYAIGNYIVSPGRFLEMLPERDSLREAIVHYAHKAGLTRATVEPGKFFGSQHLSAPMAIVALVALLVSGGFKVAVRSVDISAPVMAIMHLTHDVATVVMVVFLIAHVTLGSLVPWSWPLFRSMFTGYVSLGYAEREHPSWIRALRARQVLNRHERATQDG